MENVVPVIVQYEDGTCVVQLPNGAELAAVGLEKAQEVVDYYFESDKPKRRIGFVIQDQIKKCREL